MFPKNLHLPALAILLATALSCGRQQGSGTQQPPAVAVQTEPVASRVVSYYDEYPASVVALNQVDLRAQVSGYITGIYFTDGAHVQKGQKLYSIDPQQYEANYQQAQANLQVQETNLVKARKDAERYHELDKNDAIAKQQVDYADAALAAAEKQVEAAKATVRAMQTSVRYTSIYAPFSGTIGISQVKMGSPVTAGQTVLNVVSSDNPMAVDISVDQSEIYRFTRLQTAGRKQSDSSFRLVFGNEVYPQAGHIALIDRAVDPQTSTIKARLEFPNPDNRLRAGMTGTVRVLHNDNTPVVVIPYKAITEQLGEYFTYIVGDSSKVSQRKVKLGRQLGQQVIIKDGLKPGETLVTEGVQNLREGAVVSVANGEAKQ